MLFAVLDNRLLLAKRMELDLVYNRSRKPLITNLFKMMDAIVRHSNGTNLAASSNAL